MKAKDFDAEFEQGKNVTKHLKLSKARQVNEEIKRVNIDFPTWVIAGLDNEAKRLGVTRQSLVKIWIAERLDKPQKNAAQN